MAVKLELIEETGLIPIRKDLGTMPGRLNSFPNYTFNGEREILVFKSGKNSTAVYLANPGIDEVDIEENGISKDNASKLDVLKEGENDFIREAVSKEGRHKILRFTHINQISPRRRLN